MPWGDEANHMGEPIWKTPDRETVEMLVSQEV
jgi:hypothetical protein